MTRDDWDEVLFEFECFLSELLLVTLKFVGIINWAWFWVLVPGWIWFAYKTLSKRK